MKILVTGGAGFIGTHLCRQLTAKGHDVVVLDIADPKNPVAGVRYVRGDVRNDADLKKVLDGVSAVYHFAAIVSVPVCQQQPLEGTSTNLMATTQVLEAIRNERDRSGRLIRMIFAGSSVVYGDLGQEKVSLREDGPTAWPVSFYGAQKLGSEHSIRLFNEVFQIPAVVFRFFNVYGPGQDPSSPYSGVISIFSRAVREGLSMRLNGGGNQTRDFVSVHDVARANVLALDVPAEKCDGRAMNLGIGKSVTIRELAETMIKVSGRSVPIEVAPPRSGDVLHSQASIERANQVLGWRPQVDLNQGLSELLLNLR